MKKYIAGALLAVSSFTFVSAQQADIDPIGGTQTQCTILSSSNLRLRARDVTTNNEVSLLQGFLQDRGFLTGEPTGFFGNATLAAVKSFQTQNGLSPTGYVGPITKGKIQGLSCGGVTTSVTTSTVTTDPSIEVLRDNKNGTVGTPTTITVRVRNTTATSVVYRCDTLSTGFKVSQTSIPLTNGTFTNTSIIQSDWTNGPSQCIWSIPGTSATTIDAFQYCPTATIWNGSSCRSASNSTSVVTASSLSVPALKLNYDSANKETFLTAAFYVKINAGNEDLLIAKPGYPIAPNAHYLFGELQENNAYGGVISIPWTSALDEGSYYRIGAGKSATFSILLSYETKRMFAGSYTVKMNLSSYNGLAIPFDGPITTNRVIVIGENAVIGTSQPTSAPTTSTSVTQTTTSGTPTITNISSLGQSAGTVVAGTQATITGIGLSGNVTVLYGGTTSVLGTAQSDTVATFTVPTFAAYPSAALFTVTNNQGKISAPYRVTVLVPPPTASLTVNGAYSVTLRPGEANTKVWSSTNGTSWRSTYAYTGTCPLAGKSGEWTATTPSGTESVVATSDFIGCTVAINYFVTNSSGLANAGITMTFPSDQTIANAIGFTDSSTSNGSIVTRFVTRVTGLGPNAKGCTGTQASKSAGGQVPCSIDAHFVTLTSQSGWSYSAETDTYSIDMDVSSYGFPDTGYFSVFMTSGGVKVEKQWTPTRPYVQPVTLKQSTGQVLGASAGAACTDLKNKMFLGTRDVFVENEVSELQAFLNKKGYLNESPSGYFGSVTESAVKVFQKDNSLIVTGIVGKVTRDTIQKLSCPSY